MESYKEYLKTNKPIQQIAQYYDENEQNDMYAYKKSDYEFAQVISNIHDYIGERVGEEEDSEIANYYQELANVFNSADLWQTLTETFIFQCSEGKVVYSDENIVVTITQY